MSYIHTWIQITKTLRHSTEGAIIIDWIMRTSNKENGTSRLTICKRCNYCLQNETSEVYDFKVDQK